MLITLLSRKFTGVLSPCGEEVSATMNEEGIKVEVAMAMFPFPCGEEVSATVKEFHTTVKTVVGNICFHPLTGKR